MLSSDKEVTVDVLSREHTVEHSRLTVTSGSPSTFAQNHCYHWAVCTSDGSWWVTRPGPFASGRIPLMDNFSSNHLPPCIVLVNNFLREALSFPHPFTDGKIALGLKAFPSPLFLP